MFSYSLGDITKLDWFAVYPPSGNWICQFPLLYFFIQKLTFNVFGLSTLTMRLSVLPYIFITFLFLFLIAKRLYNTETAIIAVLLLSVFSPDLYLSKWALHFTSSTALFLVTTFFFVLCIQESKKIHFAAFGFFLGTCYMTYYSSYIAAPLFIAYVVFLILTKKISKSLLKKFLFSGITFLYTIGPLLMYAFAVDNFFTQRTSQVALINGAWSPYQNIILTPQSILDILSKQISLSVQSLYTDGIGGHAGYWFGKLALFDITTFLFLCVGILYFLYKIFKEKSANSFFVLLTIAVTFITGVVFTIPPPAFHRLSIAFPFIVLLLSVTVTDFYLFFKRKSGKTGFIFLLACLVALFLGNILHFGEVLKTDGPDDPDFPRIQQELQNNKAQKVYIASFASYSLGKVLFVRSNKKINSITLPLEKVLLDIPYFKTSFLVIVYPNEESMRKVKNAFSHTQILSSYNTHLLLKIEK